VRPLPYTSALKDFRDLLCRIGLDPTGYSEHSMRRGGGATEASLSGASTHEIQEAGNWHIAAKQLFSIFKTKYN